MRFNISYGKPDASDAEIYHAARSAALGAFIETLPEKLDTIVGERGVRLSGGERQRVGNARCIIKSPGIVLLDEASSALVSCTHTHAHTHTPVNTYPIHSHTQTDPNLIKTILHPNCNLLTHRILTLNVQFKQVCARCAKIEPPSSLHIDSLPS